MSPSLFNLYMDVMMRKVIESESGGMMDGQERVQVEVALLADSWQVMVAILMRMEEVTQRVLYIGRDERSLRVDISLGGQAMKQVEELTYPGSVITSDGKFV